jgi:TPR repeat protein
LDKTARIWDRRTGGQLALLSGHDDRVLSAVYSPDGRHVATASFDKTARIWDAGTGAEVIVLAGHSQAVSAAAYSPDGRWLVTASFDKTARVWDVRTGATIHVLAGHAGPLQAACFSPDGMRIVTASSDKTARIWDAHTGAQLAVLSGHQDSLQSAVFSPDGLRILTASMDRSARIWDARAPASAETQILWYAAAATDPLPDADRAELGLMPDARTRPWPEEASPCDRDAAAFYDPDRRSRGVMSKDIAVDIATPVCSAEIGVAEHSPRSDYQMGRILAAKGDVKGARPLLETAAAKGYRAAGVDLADLLLPASQGVLDPGRAVSLYESALQRGVTAAAFRLGFLYEYGLQDRGIAVRDAFRQDKVQAWVWYQHGADLGEPSALARLAEREENAALAATDPSQRNAAILKAFSLYAAAAERARAEDWPDDAWKHWRYRRASLARLLAQQGMMQQAAAAYSAMSAKYFPVR